MSLAQPVEDRRLQAIGLMMLAVLGFTGIDTCAKWLVLHGVPTSEAVFVRYFGHLVLVVTFSLGAGEAFVRTSNFRAVALRSAFLFLATALNFTAVRFLPLTVTAAIAFSGPLWICLLSIPMLGERVGPRRWAAMFVGFLGVLVVTRPWSGAIHWAVLLTLGAALSTALYAILTRRLAGRDSTATQQFYAGLLAAVGMAPLAFADWAWPATGASWVAFVLIGFFGWGSHQLLIVAHRHTAASTLAPFIYVQIVYMTASSWLIFGQPPDVWVLVGAGIVVASGLYIWLRERSLAAAAS